MGFGFIKFRGLIYFYLWIYLFPGSMSSSKVIIKTLLGTAFAGLGYFLTTRLFNFNLFGISHLLPTLAAFILGAFSILILPVLGFRVSEWARGFVASAFKETLAEFLGAQVGRMRERASHLRSKEESKDLGGMILDTSVIIDGRVLDVAKAGFLLGRIIVPQFVLDELQRIADSKDGLRRKKGRRGLEVLKALKEIKKRDLEILEENWKRDEVDKMLVTLARGRKAALLTVDFNLNRAAQVSGVKVLNINELANALKTILVPGEKVEIEIIAEGKEEGQGVGYLEDGTMVVVEDAQEQVGKKAEVEITRVIQTEAGRMLFARRNSAKTPR